MSEAPPRINDTSTSSAISSSIAAGYGALPGLASNFTQAQLALFVSAYANETSQFAGLNVDSTTLTNTLTNNLPTILTSLSNGSWQGNAPGFSNVLSVASTVAQLILLTIQNHGQFIWKVQK